MPPTESLSPTTAEIKQQLERMLRSVIFEARPQQAKVFEFLVTRTLDGQEITQKNIRDSVFPTPPYDPDSTIVRTTINYIRDELLNAYYEHEGKDDPVIIILPRPSDLEKVAGKKISLPAGQAYRPLFFYSPTHETAMKYKLGLRHVASRHPARIEMAIRCFSEVLKTDSGHAQAYTSMAEASCPLPFWQHFGEGYLYVEILELAKLGMALDPNSWRAKAAYGACKLLLRDFSGADGAFDAAATLDRGQMREYFWCHVFILVAGDSENAIKLLEATAQARFDDAYVHALYALFLYLQRDYSAAREEIASAILLDLNCWLAYLALALVQLASEDSQDAYASISNMQRALGWKSGEFFLPGLSALSIIKALGMTEKKRKSLLANITRHVAKSGHCPYSQKALLWIAQGENEKAADTLCHAWLHYDPVVLFAHLLPLFDPLREIESFKMLLQNRHLPHYA